MFPPFIVSGWAAREDLWANLRSGRLPAQGKRCGTSERQAIPMSEWTDLDWLADRAAPADTVGCRIENAPKYDEVRVLWQKVREIWPPLEELPSGEYHRQDWSVDHATLWIAYRNPTLFHFVGLNGPRVQAEFSSAERRESKPRKALLEALKLNKLRAIRNGKEIPPEYWFGRDLPRRQPEAKSIYFRRSDVLSVFEEMPPVPSNAKNESLAIKRLASHFIDDHKLKRSDAASMLKQAGLTITGRPFDRVWRKARVQAGLPEKAPPGRPKKSPR